MTSPGPDTTPGGGSATSRRWPVFILGAVVLSLLFAYVGWWGWWLGHGRLPPSVLLHYAGIPSPTTGCARSLECLRHGDLLRSLEFNPFMLPIFGLFIATLAALALRILRGRPPLLSNRWLIAWVVVLALGWASKFVLGRLYW